MSFNSIKNNMANSIFQTKQQNFVNINSANNENHENHENHRINESNANEFRPGSLYLIIGPMYSGKTTNILDLYKKYTFLEKETLVINYAEDTRYHSSMLSTHDKNMIPCTNLLELSELTKPEFTNKYEIILINEGQFFPDLKSTVIELVEKYNKTVYVTGLDGDFKRNPFPQMVELIPLCDDIIKTKSFCKKCKNGNLALFSHRITSETAIKVIGSDNYIPLCRKCYIDLNKK